MIDFFGYKVNAEYNADEIALTTTFHDGFGKVETISREVLKLKERAARDALIALGWTPPPERELDPSNKSA